MSGPTFTNYAGYGEREHNASVYSQAVRIGDTIEISGQGGWKTQGDEDPIPTDLAEEISNAFHNVDITIKNAGGAGWGDVYKIRSYHCPPLNDTVLQLMIAEFKKWAPDVKPIWTMLGVASLALPGMNVEIEVTALVRKE